MTSFEILIILDGNGNGAKWNLALDVGCGAGQGTVRLCDYFHKVIGIDTSVSQIHCAVEVRTTLKSLS